MQYDEQDEAAIARMEGEAPHLPSRRFSCLYPLGKDG